MNEVKLALEMNKLVHNECKDVPHDIGLRLLEIVKRNVNEQLRQPPVMVRSEQLPCFHCGRPLKEHSKDSKLCPDRMKNFEQGN